MRERRSVRWWPGANEGQHPDTGEHRLGALGDVDAASAIGRITGEQRAVTATATGDYPVVGLGGEPDDDGDPPDGKGRVRRVLGWRPTSRRQVFGLVAGGFGAVLAGTWFTRGGGDGSLVVVPPPPDLTDRAVAAKPSEAGGFANREASYTAGTEAEVNAADANLYASASEAAAQTEVTTPTILAIDDPVKHLLRRVTFGPNQPLVDEVHAQGIDAWLAQQLDPGSIDDGVAQDVFGQFPLAAMGPAEIQQSIERYHWDAMFEYGQATLGRQIWSRRQLYEVMVDFWANHLNVSTPGGSGWDVANSYQEGVVREHALGSYTDLLLAAMRHPAMLRYLSNDLSDKDDVNENLGRELLELHTVGVASGYTEDDVRNSAYILTGRTVSNEHTMQEMGEMPEGSMAMDEMSMGMGSYGGAFLFEANKHWKDPVKVLDFTHPNPTREGGMEVGDEYLRYLATHPSTAHNIARKLAVRFVSDAPPDTLVERMSQAYLDNDTQIVPVLDVLFRSGEFWASVGQKVRRPLENAIASARALEVQPGGDTKKAMENLYWQVGSMGHRPLAWPSPDGYPDVRQAWRSTSAVLSGWNLHRSLVQGWQEGLTYVSADQLVAGRPSATIGEYVDSLCQRLCLQGFKPEHRDALIAFTEQPAEASSEDAWMHDMVNHLAPLVLDSPYFSLR
jgi:uncharacterized protein (DUF1800 family)